MDNTNAPPSTDTRPNVIEDTENICNVFCCAALGDATTGIFYTDMTGVFPVTSLEKCRHIVSHTIMIQITYLLYQFPILKMKQLLQLSKKSLLVSKTRDTRQPSTSPTIKQQRRSKRSLKGRLQVATCRAKQSSHQRSGKGNSDLQEPFDQWISIVRIIHSLCVTRAAYVIRLYKL